MMATRTLRECALDLLEQCDDNVMLNKRMRNHLGFNPS